MKQTTPKGRMWSTGRIAALALALLVIGGVAAVALRQPAETPEPLQTRPDPVVISADTAWRPSGDASGQPSPAREVPAVSPHNQYRAEVIAINDAIASGLDALVRRLIAARYTDQEWLDETRTVLASMRSSATRARAIRVPTEYRAAHAVWLEGIEAYDSAAKDMAVAIEGPDESLITSCSKRFEQASAKFREATALMQAVTTP